MFKMTKKKAAISIDKKDTPSIPHNTGGRRQERQGGLITGWMNYCKRGSPLKITPTNKKIKVKGKAPMKEASASTYATKKPQAKNPPPTTILPPRTAGRNYTKWKQQPNKSVLAHTVEEKLKVLDTQLAAGGVIIPDGTLRDHWRYTKGEAKNWEV